MDLSSEEMKMSEWVVEPNTGELMPEEYYVELLVERAFEGDEDAERELECVYGIGLVKDAPDKQVPEDASKESGTL